MFGGLFLIYIFVILVNVMCLFCGVIIGNNDNDLGDEWYDCGYWIFIG